MRRREFITLIGGAVAAWPFTAFGKAQRIALVYPSVPVSKMTETSDNPGLQAFFSELRRLGYVEGQSLVIERYSGGRGRAPRALRLASSAVPAYACRSRCRQHWRPRRQSQSSIRRANGLIVFEQSDIDGRRLVRADELVLLQTALTMRPVW